MKIAKIVILAGQSNAVGVGHVKCLPKHFSAEKIQEYFDGYENIKINYFSHDKKSNGFVKTTVGCTEVSKHTVGPELGLAESFSKTYPDEEIFIIKCAFGGANLYGDWRSPSAGDNYEPDAYYHNRIISEEPLRVRVGWCYNELIKIVSESIEILKNDGYTPSIRAFCWMQGEGDSGCMENVEKYEERFQSLLNDFEAQFGQYIDNYVCVDAGISDFNYLYKEMNLAKQTNAQNKENRFYIDTIGEGLTTRNEPEEDPDIAHYDSDSIIKLGWLFADRIKL